jgi:hypothetical protein
MSVTLPNAATANTDTNTSITAATTAAQDRFVADVTVLINNAITNGIFFVEPYAAPLVTPDYVKGYFEPLGYTVVFPLVPPGPFNPTLVPGFPEVLPSDIVGNGDLPGGNGLPRYKISWGP